MTATTDTRLTLWSSRADVAQDSLTALWGAPTPQLLHNTHPADDDTLFNYWWLAHVIDCRVDAYLRTGDPRWRDEAAAVAANIRERNGGSLFNDYFDDMLWYGLALLRLAEISDGVQAQATERDAVVLWEHVLAEGWTEVHGGSVSWRRQQPDYKNTPANGPFVILGARLARRTGRTEMMAPVWQAMSWLGQHLVREDGLVWDGLGREGCDTIDLWRFTYNQGLYIGACVEMFRTDHDPTWLDRAERTATVSIAELAREGVFVRDGGDLDDQVPDVDGGDTGLFKGIWYRYAGQLLEHRSVPEVVAFVQSSTDALWQHGLVEVDGRTLLRAGDDWTRPAPRLVGFSTQLSAIMALELRARLEA